jgi:hypothetical protein
MRVSYNAALAVNRYNVFLLYNVYLADNIHLAYNAALAMPRAPAYDVGKAFSDGWLGARTGFVSHAAKPLEGGDWIRQPMHPICQPERVRTTHRLPCTLARARAHTQPHTRACTRRHTQAHRGTFRWHPFSCYKDPMRDEHMCIYAQSVPAGWTEKLQGIVTHDTHMPVWVQGSQTAPSYPPHC